MIGVVGIWGGAGRFDCFSVIVNEEGADLGQGLVAHGVGEEAEMADTMEARGQDMEELCNESNYVARET